MRRNFFGFKPSRPFKTKTSTPNQSNQVREAGDAECKIDVEFDLKDTTTTTTTTTERQSISLFFSHNLYADLYVACLEKNALDHRTNQPRDWDFLFSRDPANTKHVTLTITPKKEKTTTPLSPILVDSTETSDGEIKMEFANMVYAMEWVQRAKLWTTPLLLAGGGGHIVLLKTAMSFRELKNLLGLEETSQWNTGVPAFVPPRGGDHAILLRPPSSFARARVAK